MYAGLGGLHHLTALALTCLGNVERELGALPESLALLERALAIRERVKVGPADLARSQLALGKTLLALRRDPERARQLLQQAEAGLRTASRPQEAEAVRSFVSTVSRGVK